MNLDPEKVLVLFVIALLVLGPERLPQAARALGKGLAEVRKYTSSFQSEVNNVLAEPRSVIQSALHEADMRGQFTPPPLLGPEAPGLPARESPPAEMGAEGVGEGVGGADLASEGVGGEDLAQATSASPYPGAPPAGPTPAPLPSAVPDDPSLN